MKTIKKYLAKAICWPFALLITFVGAAAVLVGVAFYIVKESFTDGGKEIAEEVIDGITKIIKS